MNYSNLIKVLNANTNLDRLISEDVLIFDAKLKQYVINIFNNSDSNYSGYDILLNVIEDKVIRTDILKNDKIITTYSNFSVNNVIESITLLSRIN